MKELISQGCEARNIVIGSMSDGIYVEVYWISTDDKVSYIDEIVHTFK